ncbi:MAG: cytochrome c nitrite reductase small subunit [Anaerolineae bacterium]|nr:cytochrome c nitrite reductase small subunit [Anaerolineae bacterium]
MRLLGFVPFGIWIVAVGLLGGIVGLGGFTFSYAEGLSYFSDDPQACVNCHVMREVFEGWNHSSHKAVAVCNDCHIPHTLPDKYIMKGLNGWNHSRAFTTGDFPEPIRITPRNREVLLHNCLYCHGDLVSAISHENSTNPTDCVACHAGVGHGR